MSKTINSLQPTDEIASLDIHFARLIARAANRASGVETLLAALTSARTRAGHVCLELAELADEQLVATAFGSQINCKAIPAGRALKAYLSGSSVVGAPGEYKPLILDDDRLYLHRYWSYQERLAASIRSRAKGTATPEDSEAARAALNRYFSNEGNGLPDWQKVAAANALLKNIVIISGGPGTGKTYTVAKILALLVDLSPHKALKIALAAPTGKAAARLQESIRQVKTTLTASEEILQRVPEEAATIHRLLGYIPNSPYFRRNASSRLDLDVLIVDEASMVDLALMSKLVQALPEDARLILLGDHNQLASVEAGSVLGDICDSGVPHARSGHFVHQLHALGADTQESPDSKVVGGIQDCIVYLKKSYRFQEDEGIAALSQAVNEGDAERALALLSDPSLTDIAWHDLTQDEPLSSIASPFFEFDFDDMARSFAQLRQYRILCAVREGPQGVNFINQQIETMALRKRPVSENDIWHLGQPLLIKENDYRLDLFNGDLGVILRDGAAPENLAAFFEISDLEHRKISPFRLPQHEMAYAMTVHKSQGSEFDHVQLLLPARDSELVTRELIYTAITRAVKRVEIWGNRDLFQKALERRIRRASGLRDAIWGKTAPAG